jgi:hypothetical protein
MHKSPSKISKKTCRKLNPRLAQVLYIHMGVVLKDTYIALRRGAVYIASTSGTDDPGSNPAVVQGFLENIAMMLCTYN